MRRACMGIISFGHYRHAGTSSSHIRSHDNSRAAIWYHTFPFLSQHEDREEIIKVMEWQQNEEKAKPSMCSDVYTLGQNGEGTTSLNSVAVTEGWYIREVLCIYLKTRCTLYPYSYWYPTSLEHIIVFGRCSFPKRKFICNRVYNLKISREIVQKFLLQLTTKKYLKTYITKQKFCFKFCEPYWLNRTVLFLAKFHCEILRRFDACQNETPFTIYMLVIFACVSTHKKEEGFHYCPL